ncbi:preprotein translocase subunit SecE [Microbacterium sp. YY-01]|uniref:preprotein translocase subunit SecE n=1 Tax=Microbacterium sp. YY-01 TaxID=3421634 RepID=UPI003D16AA02
MSQDAAVPSSRGSESGKKLGFFARIALFLRQVIDEMRKVVTPTRKELITFTSVVLVFVLIVMGLVYGFDTIFAWLTSQVFGVPGRPTL